MARSPFNSQLQDWLRIALYTSRPGLWATQLWFYLLPLGGRHLLGEPTFWLGAFYVTFPMSHLLYGWNDLADFETDRLNPRKGNLLFGAKLTRDELRRLPRQMLLIQPPFLAAFLWIVGPKLLFWIALGWAVNAAYNGRRLNLKSRPGWDLVCQCGYLLVFVLSSWLNRVPQLSWPALLFGALFAMHSHLFHEVTDLSPDRAAGRRTTAVMIGAAWSKLLVGVMLLTEAVIIAFYFSSWIVAGFLGFAGVGFLIDFAVRREKIISEIALRVVFLAWNAVAIVSAYWVWREAIFVAAR